MTKVADVMNAHREALLRQEKKAMEEQTKAWLEVEKEIEAQLQALVKLMKTQKLSSNQIRLMAEYEELKKQVRIEIEKYASYMNGQIANGQSAAIGAAISDAGQAIQAVGQEVGAGVIEFNQLPRSSVENMVGLTQTGSPLKELLDKASETAPDRLAQELINSIALGLNPRETAKLVVRKGLGPTYTQMQRIARTEQLRVYRSVSIESYKYSGAVEQYQRLSARDARTCPGCLFSDGEVYWLEKGFHEHPQGRCTLIPIIKGYKAAPIETGAEWFEKQPENVQKKIIGPALLEMLKKGTIVKSDLVDSTWDDTWGGAMITRSLKDIKAGKPKINGIYKKRVKIVDKTVGPIPPPTPIAPPKVEPPKPPVAPPEPVAKPTPPSPPQPVYREIPDAAKGDPKLHAGYKQWKSSLVPNEEDALALYSKTAATSINATLRGKKPLPIETAKTVKAIDSAIELSEVPEDLLVFRGIYHQELVKDIEAGVDVTGKLYTDAGYTSTTTSRVRGYKTPSSVVAQIRLPKGSKGAIVTPESMGENKIVLPRDSVFKIAKVEKKDGKTLITVDIEPSTPSKFEVEKPATSPAPPPEPPKPPPAPVKPPETPKPPPLPAKPAPTPGGVTPSPIPWKPVMSEADAETWSSDSKLIFAYYHVDKIGHETLTENGFDPGYVGAFQKKHGEGVYLEATVAAADKKIDAAGGPLKSDIYKVNVNVKNVASYKVPPGQSVDAYDVMSKVTGKSFADVNLAFTQHGSLTKALQAEGYDALYISTEEVDGKQLIIFEPKNVVAHGDPIKPLPSKFGEAPKKTIAWKPVMTEDEANEWAKDSKYKDDVWAVEIDLAVPEILDKGFAYDGIEVYPDYTAAKSHEGPGYETLKAKANVQNIATVPFDVNDTYFSAASKYFGQSIKELQAETKASNAYDAFKAKGFDAIHLQPTNGDPSTLVVLDKKKITIVKSKAAAPAAPAPSTKEKEVSWQPVMTLEDAKEWAKGSDFNASFNTVLSPLEADDLKAGDQHIYGFASPYTPSKAIPIALSKDQEDYMHKTVSQMGSSSPKHLTVMAKVKKVAYAEDPTGSSYNDELLASALGIENSEAEQMLKTMTLEEALESKGYDALFVQTSHLSAGKDALFVFKNTNVVVIDPTAPKASKVEAAKTTTPTAKPPKAPEGEAPPKAKPGVWQPMMTKEDANEWAKDSVFQEELTIVANGYGDAMENEEQGLLAKDLIKGKKFVHGVYIPMNEATVEHEKKQVINDKPIEQKVKIDVRKIATYKDTGYPLVEADVLAQAISVKPKEARELLAKHGSLENVLKAQGYDALKIESDRYKATGGSQIIVFNREKVVVVGEKKTAKPKKVLQARPAAPGQNEKAMNWFGRGQNSGADFPSKNITDAKIDVCDHLAKQMGIPSEDVSRFVRSWADTSNDNNLSSLSIQKAASEVFGIPLTPWQADRLRDVIKERDRLLAQGDTQTVRKHHEYQYMFEYSPSGAPKRTEAEAHEQTKKTVQEIYNRTQAELKAAGITEVTLYRGISMKPAEIKALGKKKGDKMIVTGNVLESWSLRSSVSENFMGYTGIMLKATVPVERIYSTSRTGVGCLNEWEIVVFGSEEGLDEAEIYKMNSSSW